MPIKIKERDRFKVIARCSNPMELQWLLQLLANMRNPEGKINPIVSVQNLKGEEIKVPPRPPMNTGTPPQGVVHGMPQPMVDHGQVIKVAPPEIIKSPQPIEGTPVAVCGNVIPISGVIKNEGQQPIPSVDEGKAG